MSNIIDIKSYTPKSSDLFFLDNNVWMFLFCPIGNYSKTQQRIYSRFFQSIISAKATIFVNSLILSEFSNSFLRMDFEQWKKNNKLYGANYKKDYIPTQQYKNTVAAITVAINNILSLSEKRPDDFHIIDIQSICNNFQTIDFNDSYLVEFCKNNTLKLVTDDKDFQKIINPSISIITSN